MDNPEPLIEVKVLTAKPSISAEACIALVEVLLQRLLERNPRRNFSVIVWDNNGACCGAFNQSAARACPGKPLGLEFQPFYFLGHRPSIP